MFIFDQAIAVVVTDKYFGEFELNLFKNKYGYEPMDNINSFCQFVRWLHERNVSCYIELNPNHTKKEIKEEIKFINRLKEKYGVIPKDTEVRYVVNVERYRSIIDYDGKRYESVISRNIDEDRAFYLIIYEIDNEHKEEILTLPDTVFNLKDATEIVKLIVKCKFKRIKWKEE
ncbi:hypothetical protein G7L40_00425 [Paenibacillus polymyxa]|uniref:Uncharacterized protein n=1 Tax=Paenibacillus polymyxa TaxID=1406 RepID=A0A378XXE9_PAEPO|nr:hypothetical protein [Paenibacillus polymyxa]MBE7897175.1 hypothetical protein [Paenibacillus polymyxa]MBG9763032.1 hypothetical protein [Paenibacillus polymyxa]MCC3257576.1 hypothetical protein [Paenibacillus polymyxa]QPK51341.1 hypothetical protein G7035_00425 [Paenibacillus polymyxa]QPK56431.1 hypothetical protein G7L40_00425 [Paenibacillus polymyxa]